MLTRSTVRIGPARPATPAAWGGLGWPCLQGSLSGPSLKQQAGGVIGLNCLDCLGCLGCLCRRIGRLDRLGLPGPPGLPNRLSILQLDSQGL